jgi:hypothetical protein
MKHNRYFYIFMFLFWQPSCQLFTGKLTVKYRNTIKITSVHCKKLTVILTVVYISNG